MKSAITAVMMIFITTMAAAQDTPTRKMAEGDSVRSITLPELRTGLREGEGRIKTESYCNICHSVDYITMQPGFSKAQWTATVAKMIKVFGAPIPQEDADTIASYLSTAYGPGK
jgi:sulfite dehydrogenase (cytochrome) subunit B